MSDAPERIWAQDAEPSECNYIGGGWWDDECGSVQYPHMVEYIRADLHADLIKAADELAKIMSHDVESMCQKCGGDCSAANPPVVDCDYQRRCTALAAYNKAKEKLK